MDNLVFGILTTIFCIVGYYYSWIFQKRGHFKYAVVLLLLCGLTLRIYTSTDFFLHQWDERYHALVAKNLIDHPLTPTLYNNPILPYDYRNWTANNIWLHKQPLPLWTMALSMWIFGVNEIALRLPSVLLTTIGIWITFSIASFFFNNKIGYLAAFLYSINGLIIELTGGRIATDHIDIFFLFFVQLAIYFSILFSKSRRTIYNVLAGASIGAAILSKWLPALIVMPIWILIIADSKKFGTSQMIWQFLILAITCLFIFLPWQLYIFNIFPTEANWEAGFNVRHFTEVLEGRTGPFYYFFDRIRINYGELIYIPLLWFMWKVITNLRDKNRLAIFIWFIIPAVFFSFAKTKMQAYILFTSPALFIMTAEFWNMLAHYKLNHKPQWLFNLLLLLLIALPIRYTFERMKPFEMRERNPQWVQKLKGLNQRGVKNGVLLNFEKPIEAMFYTNLTAYPNIPDKEIVADLIGKGYQILINDDGSISEDIKSIKGVEIVQLSTY